MMETDAVHGWIWRNQMKRKKPDNIDLDVRRAELWAMESIMAVTRRIIQTQKG